MSDPQVPPPPSSPSGPNNGHSLLPVPLSTNILAPRNTPAGTMQAWQPDKGRHGALPDEEKGVNWNRYLTALRRYKWLVIACTAAGALGGVAATRFVVPQYEAQATLWISTPGGSGQRQGSAAPILVNQPIQESTGWIDLFRSLSVTDSVVMKRRLYLSSKSINHDVLATLTVAPNFKPGDYVLTAAPNSKDYTLTVNPDHIVVERGTLGDSIGRTLGIQWHPSVDAVRAASPVLFSLVTPDQASGRLINRLSANLPQNSTFMTVSLVGSSPTEVATTLNLWVNEFIAMEANLKTEKVAEQTKILQSQMDLAGADLNKAEHDLEVYETNTIVAGGNGGLSPDAGTPSLSSGNNTANPASGNSSLSSYVTLTTQRDNLREDLRHLEKILNDASVPGAKLNPEDLLSVPALSTGSADLVTAISDYRTKLAALLALQDKYSNDYKPVRDAQAEVNALRDRTIPGLAQQALARLRTSEQDMTRRIDASTTSMRKLPSQQIENDRLKREYDQNVALYHSLQDKYQEARIAEASALPDVQLLDHAIPPRTPTVNTAPRLLGMVLFAGIGLGIFLAFLLDRLDPRLRYPEQATDDLGLPIIGTVPGVKRRSGRHATSDAALEEQAQIVESFRTIRLNLLNLYEPGTPVVVTITSPGAGEGKSFVASNLALSFAEGGFQTLLVDADVRRGHLHTTFGVKQSPGLLEYLVDKATIHEVLQGSPSRYLTVVAGGTRRHRGPELLASAATLQFLAAVRSQFQIIIIDCPPLGAGIDAFALAAGVGHAMIVLRIGRSDRKMAEAKLEVLDRYPVRQLGAVLNDVNSGGVFRYYSYVAGYGVEDREDSVEGQERLEIGRITAPQ